MVFDNHSTQPCNTFAPPSERSTNLSEKDPRNSLLSALLSGVPADQVLSKAAEEGRDPYHVKQELDTLQYHIEKSAYFQRVAERTADWMSMVRRELRRAEHGAGEALPVHEVAGIPAAETFYSRYYMTNTPVVFRGIFDDWGSLRPWSFGMFRERYEDVMVEYMENRDDASLSEQFPDLYRKREAFGTLIARMLNEETNSFYLVARNRTLQDAALADLLSQIAPIDGITFPADGNGYALWMGPKGTVTPLHYDAINVIHAVASGKKRFTLVPPEDGCYVYNYRSVYSAVDVGNVDARVFPLFKYAKKAVITLERGDALFIPVGWWHYVEGLTPTIAVGASGFTRSNLYPTPLPPANFSDGGVLAPHSHKRA